MIGWLLKMSSARHGERPPPGRQKSESALRWLGDEYRRPQENLNNNRSYHIFHVYTPNADLQRSWPAWKKPPSVL